MGCGARVNDGAARCDGDIELVGDTAHIGRRECVLRCVVHRCYVRARFLCLHAPTLSLLRSLTLLSASWPPAVGLVMSFALAVVANRVFTVTSASGLRVSRGR